MDYEKLMEKMIKEQIQARGINNETLIQAIRSVPRHEFVKEADKNYAYDDRPIPIGYGQTISQPFIVAYMTQELEVKNNMKVLEIGTGSGYQAAILSKMAAKVYSIERIKEIHDFAYENLKKIGITNVHLKIGDGTIGWQEEAPFDRIIITGAVPDIPYELEEQVNKDDGIIIAPVGSVLFQKLRKLKFKDKIKEVEEKIGCIFVSIYGKYGFKDN
ncbi:MAG TPA: protein-L-isoaspartate(D-aspartate) O-methyltransferase [Candidatus Goldiibacteriota bacterium]|nr:protein-L-isoaspartate(D-aspartate) O-methyltransferase [Candidatus Goldiibacteriota bacterium]